MSRRPLGVTFSAVLLGLLLAIPLLTIGTLAVLAIRPGAEGALVLGAIVISIPMLAIAAWLLFTLIGLVRLKSSARISIQILATLLILFGLAQLVGATIFHAYVPQSGSSRAYLFGLFLPAALSLALGIGWLIYFNLRAVADSFQPAWLQRSPSLRSSSS